MRLKTTSIIKKITSSSKPNLANLIFFVLFFSIFFLTPTTAIASCCKCTHTDIEGIFCIEDQTAPCEDLAKHNNELKDAKCSSESQDTSCRLIKNGGICIKGPIDLSAFKMDDFTKQSASDEAKTTVTDFEPTLLNLNVEIPNLKFTNPYVKDNQVIIPYLGQYIQALYKLLLGISLIASAFMVVIGAYKYLIGATGAKVQSGKDLIIDALMGLVIIFGAYVILSNVNPNLTKFGSLTVPFVEPDTLKILPKSTHKAAAGQSDYYNNDENVTAEEVYAKAETLARKEGVDPCIVKAIIKTESAGQIGAIGHDENFAVNFTAQRSIRMPQSRIDFLRSRKYHSGKMFDSSVRVYPSNCFQAINGQPNPDYAKCRLLAGTDGSNTPTSPLNDDTFDPTKPDYNLDTRFTHGFGISQLTIPVGLPQCDGHWSAQIGETCFTGADLLTLEGGVNAIIKNPGVQKNKNNPSEAFWSYIGVRKGNEGLHQKKMTAYSQCNK